MLICESAGRGKLGGRLARSKNTNTDDEEDDDEEDDEDEQEPGKNFFHN